jgi:DNA-directed RNA polymerase subunit RPC12/RpoP
MCPFGPLDYFFYDEFLEPEKEYVCSNCGTRFGNECVAANEAGGYVAQCPGCGRQLAVH